MHVGAGQPQHWRPGWSRRRVLSRGPWLAGVLLGGCGLTGPAGSAGPTSPPDSVSPPNGSGVTTAPTSMIPASPGPLIVFADSALTEAFEGARPGLRYRFAGSQTVVTELLQHAPADLVVTADEETMERATRAGAVDLPTVCVAAKLAIVAAPGNPFGLRGLGDLRRPGLRVAIAQTAVPVGQTAEQVLAKARVALKPVARPLDVKSTLAEVTAGRADAALVYQPDARSAGAAVSTVPVHEDDNLDSPFCIAVVRATDRREEAEEFKQATLSGDLRRALLELGFLVP